MWISHNDQKLFGLEVLCTSHYYGQMRQTFCSQNFAYVTRSLEVILLAEKVRQREQLATLCLKCKLLDTNNFLLAMCFSEY